MFSRLEDNYGLTYQDFCRYLKVRQYYLKEIKAPGPQIKENPIVHCVVQAYSRGINKTASILYQGVKNSKIESTECARSAWAKELSANISAEAWGRMYKAHF